MNKKQKITASLGILALLQVPFAIKPTALKPLATSTVQVGDVSSGKNITTGLADLFFGNRVSAAEKQDIVTKQEAFVSSRDAYTASKEVVQNHADEIKKVAAANNVPADVAIGVAFLENGGSETAKSSAGAVGIYQLMPSTARNLGLTVTKKVDERKNPEKSIEAGVSYLAHNYDVFGDWGLATWAYHAGEGNVAKALQIYARVHDSVILPGPENPDALRAYVTTRGITVHELLSDPAVQKFTNKLNDDSAGYPYKVIATANLFNETGN